MTAYAGFDQAALDLEYSPSSRVADLAAVLAEYTTRSARARVELVVHTDLRYGPGHRMTLDFFPATRPAAPLLVYLHGGYWQEMGKSDFAFPALGLVPAGAAFAALGYGLAPEHDLDEIVAATRRGLWWLVTHAAELGVDPGRIHLSGHSAGAHLAAMALLDGWLPGRNHPVDVFAGAILTSGVYDLEPIRRSYVNERLGLDSDAAERNSPLRRLPDRLPPLILARGADETGEFARQQHEFAEAVAPRAGALDTLVARNRNHFDLVFDLADPATRLGRAVFAQLGLSAAGAVGSP